MKVMKLQSAMEYLATYSWAILIIAVVVSALFTLGIFNPNGIVSSQCFLPAGFSCPIPVMYPNGLLLVNIQQLTQSTINVTAVGCNTTATVVNNKAPLNPPSNQITMLISSNYTFPVQCYSGNAVYSGSPSSSYSGYLIVNYTTPAGFPQTITGRLMVKVQ